MKRKTRPRLQPVAVSHFNEGDSCIQRDVSTFIRRLSMTRTRGTQAWVPRFHCLKTRNCEEEQSGISLLVDLQSVVHTIIDRTVMEQTSLFLFACAHVLYQQVGAMAISAYIMPGLISAYLPHTEPFSSQASLSYHVGSFEHAS